MATVANQKIRDDYPHYLEVVGGPKVVQPSISLQIGGANNANWLGAKVEVDHATLEFPIQFVAEKNIRRPTSFKFKLMASHLAKEPVFRFDSDGTAHRNDFDNIPLPEQQVTTPHFHRFNEAGFGVAYKTEVLKSPGDAAAIVADVNFGMAHFSAEANVKVEGGDAPTLQENQELFPMPANQDPVAGVNFT